MKNSPLDDSGDHCEVLNIQALWGCTITIANYLLSAPGKGSTKEFQPEIGLTPGLDSITHAKIGYHEPSPQLGNAHIDDDGNLAGSASRSASKSKVKIQTVSPGILHFP